MDFLYILLAFLVFGLLIFIHELGHYIAARCFGVKIFEFAIGMGPRLAWYRSKKTGIVYAFRAIPFGGFVSMAGELTDEGAEDLPPEAKETFPGDEHLTCLAVRPAWQRLIVHMAGAVMNLILGVVIVVTMTVATPHRQLGSTVVAEFGEKVEGVVSTQEQGLMVGDEIYSVGGKRVHIADELSYQILHKGGTGKPIPVVVIRDGEKKTLDITFPRQQDAATGMTFGATDFKVYRIEKKNFGSVIHQSFYKFCFNATMVWDSLIDLVSGKYTMDAVSGPIGTADAIGNVAKSGNAQSFFSFVALITINLGIFNLLPIPALDGAHVLYTLIELVTRKKPPAKFITVVDTIGLIVLLGFMCIITFKDCTKLFR